MREPRFDFGRNWQRFLRQLDETRITEAVNSLSSMLGADALDGAGFLDAGSGSGLFSLAARRLGASVTSFDYDEQSVACTATLRDRFSPDDDAWRVEQGSVLDQDFLEGLGEFDIVYSWGVLHHTGAMWDAMERVVPAVAQGGLLYIALYNDQGLKSRVWAEVKRIYNRGGAVVRALLIAGSALVFWAPATVVDTLRGRPLDRWRNYSSARGMSRSTDLIDWVGGYPFEVARPGDVVEFYVTRGFTPLRLRTTNGSGCNEFVFARIPVLNEPREG